MFKLEIHFNGVATHDAQALMTAVAYDCGLQTPEIKFGPQSVYTVQLPNVEAAVAFTQELQQADEGHKLCIDGNLQTLPDGGGVRLYITPLNQAATVTAYNF